MINDEPFGAGPLSFERMEQTILKIRAEELRQPTIICHSREDIINNILPGCTPDQATTFIEADRHGFVKYCDKVPAGSIFMVPGIDVAIDGVNVVVMWPYPAPPVTKP